MYIYLMYCDICPHWFVWANHMWYKVSRWDIQTSTSSVIFIYLFLHFIYLYFYFYCVLSILMSCHYMLFLIWVLHASIHYFILCVSCKFNSIFYSQNTKKIISIHFLFESYKLIDLGITQLDRKNFDLILKWIGFEMFGIYL